MSNGWNCASCSFHHNYPGTRCSMCSELRVNKAHMRDFVLGKPIPKDVTTNSGRGCGTGGGIGSIKAAAAPSPRQRKVAAAAAAAAPSPQQQTKSSNLTVGTGPVLHNKIAPVVRHNPYAKQQQQRPQQRLPPRPISNQNEQLPQQQQQQRPTPLPNRAPSPSNSSQHRSSSAAPANLNSNARQQPCGSATTAVNNNMYEQKPQQHQVQSQHSRQRRTPSNNNNNSHVALAGAPWNTSVNANQQQLKRPPVQAGDQSRLQPQPPPNSIPNIEQKKHASHKTEYQPGPVPLDMSTADTWIYPIAEAYPKRQYQFDISQSAVMQNTLVSLPTGLGKTLIAAVVLYNYYRWFPTGKVIFLAPTLPLVDQQVKACYEIMGIPATDTSILTGKVKAKQRTVLWKNKRVFFATPQTVEKDLESEQQRCPANQVVCVVLDEAHKATGEYAYTKVIRLLRDAGAKFRVLGLSATPGTTIKAIQQVVEVLMINHIEARNDSDANVKQYIHERSTEVVVVKQVAASKNVERMLDSLIAPILATIRSLGGLRNRTSGNATLQPYCIFSAKQEHLKNADPHDKVLLTYYDAAYSLIDIRQSLHVGGIGTARHKMAKIVNGRKYGHLATVVKSPEFQQLWREVEEVSCDPNAANNTVDDKLVNNPKLAKLVEILTEHFERARASGTSSRAIVFSQFRDSVAEIVGVLDTASRSLIRARYFVGQSKGANTDEGQKVKGMKQEEQKKVIAEFRSDQHNVLVCTCIGEEGLDIGEVDLIVNFDCLSSPIRMIQRVGRTGRKRDGRVVTLVAEGPEERTLSKSQLNEQKLARALKNPETFNVAPNVPMFPSDPVVFERNMTISQNFHLSQVHGAGKKKKRHSSVGSSGPRKKALASGPWKLSEAEERDIANVFGHLGDLRLDDSDVSSFPPALRHRFLTARTMSVSLQKKNGHRRLQLGRTSMLLRKIEVEHAAPADLTKTTAVGRARKSSKAALETLFPLVIFDSAMIDDAAITRAYGSASTPLKPSTAGASSEMETYSLAERDGQVERDETRSIATNETGIIARPPPTDLLLQNNPYASRINIVTSRHNDMSRGEDQYTAPLNAMTAIGQSMDNDQAHVVDSSIGNNGCQQFPDTTDAPEMEEFRLPSQPDSSSDSSDGESTSAADVTVPAAVPPEKPAVSEEFRLPTQSSDEDGSDTDADDKEAAPKQKEASVQEAEFRLPTPESSSSEEGSESETEEANNEFFPLLGANDGSKRPKTPETNSDASSAKELAIPDTQSSAAGRVRFSLDNSIDATAAFSPFRADDTPAFKKKSNPNKHIMAIQDTQDTPQFKPEPLPQTTEPGNDLENTQEDAKEVVDNVACVCAVCLGNHLSEEDPIILCDGSGNGVPCGLAVHYSCYSLFVDLDDDGEWRCDSCDFRRCSSGLAHSIQCTECGKEAGAMKRCALGKWKHLRCPPLPPQSKPCRLKRARKQSDLACAEARPPLIDLPPNEEDNGRKKRRRQCLQRFIDDEAAADSDGALDGDREEDDDVPAIEEEEEEFASGFINDSSQLGYSQDELDCVDPDPVDNLHRLLDLERERNRQFTTPGLNRRTRERRDHSQWSGTSASAAGSLSGLGNMHFIRSVLEHQRQGGRPEDIEMVYNDLENASGLSTEMSGREL